MDGFETLGEKRARGDGEGRIQAEVWHGFKNLRYEKVKFQNLVPPPRSLAWLKARNEWSRCESEGRDSQGAHRNNFNKQSDFSTPPPHPLTRQLSI